MPISFDDFKARLAASKAKFEQKKQADTGSAAEIGDTVPAQDPQDVQDQQPIASSQPQPPAWSGAKPRKRGKRDQQQQTVDVQRESAPHSVEAEQGVISSIMRDCQRGERTVIAEVASKINENFFYVPAHKTIYEMMVSLWRANRPIDLISFTEFMRRKDILAAVGGAAYVTELHSYIDKLTNFVPTAAAVDYYVAIVREKFARREIIADATRLVRSAYGADADEFSGIVQRVTNRIVHIGAATNGQFPQLQDTADFFSTDDPPLPKLVIHHLLHRGSKMLLGGNSKGRKTWALMDLAIAVSCGVDWWGFHTQRGAVCYINLELQPEFFRVRQKKICEVRNIQPERGMFMAWHLRGHAKPMTQLIGDLLGFLKQYRFKLIIIDPIYKTLPAFRGSENDSAMITQLLNEVETIAVETGAAVLFCSHFSKGDQADKESMDRVSGSGAWARDPDTLLTMTAHEEQDCFTVEATLRNLAPIFPLVVKWDYPLFVRQDELSPDRLKRRGPKAASPDKLLDVLSEFNGQEPKDVLQQMRDQHGITRATVYRMKTVLEERGQLKTEDGLWLKVKPETEQKATSE
jgi:hypothetical protein